MGQPRYGLFSFESGWLNTVYKNDKKIGLMLTIFIQVQYSNWNPTRKLNEQKFIKTEIELGQYKNKTEFNAAIGRIKVLLYLFDVIHVSVHPFYSTTYRAQTTCLIVVIIPLLLSVVSNYTSRHSTSVYFLLEIVSF